MKKSFLALLLLLTLLLCGCGYILVEDAPAVQILAPSAEPVALLDIDTVFDTFF